MSTKNIMKVLLQATPETYQQGLTAYQDYHNTLKATAEQHNLKLERVIGAFSALSPGNRIEMNFKDLDTLISGVAKGKESADIRLHCYSLCSKQIQKLL